MSVPSALQPHAARRSSAGTSHSGVPVVVQPLGSAFIPVEVSDEKAKEAIESKERVWVCVCAATQ